MAQHGSVVRGPDGLNYQLGLDGQWRPYVMSGGSAPAHSASQPYRGVGKAPPSVANNVMPMISPATTSQWASEGVQFKATPIKDARVLIPQYERIDRVSDPVCLFDGRNGRSPRGLKGPEPPVFGGDERIGLRGGDVGNDFDFSGTGGDPLGELVDFPLTDRSHAEIDQQLMIASP